MNITFRQLRLFLALADTGSVSGAAQALHVTQPTASTQLRDMAQAVGLPLYDLVGRRVHLTDVGRELAQTARTMAQAWDDFAQGVDAVKGLSRGRLRVAVVSTAQYFMPRLIQSFCQRHPALDVSLQILNRDGIVQRLRQNMDDLYIMSMPPTDMDLVDQVFLPNPLVLVAPSGSAWVGRAQPWQWPELSGQRFILRERGSGTRMAVDRFFRHKRFKADVRMALGSNEAVKESVAAGLGLGVLSVHALHNQREDHGVSVVEVEDFPLQSSWHLVHVAQRGLSPLAAAFKQHLLAASPEGQDGSQ